MKSWPGSFLNNLVFLCQSFSNYNDKHSVESKQDACAVNTKVPMSITMKKEQRPKSARAPNFNELDEKLKVPTSKLDLTVKFKSLIIF